MSASVIVTGIAELNEALSLFSVRLQKKYIRKALRNSLKKVQADFKERVPVGEDEDGEETGVMRDSAKIRAKKRSRKNVLGLSLVIDRKTYMQLYFERYGRFPGARRGDSEPFFVPAAIELGGAEGDSQRPMRAALYGNEQQVKAEFISQLTEAVATAGK